LNLAVESWNLFLRRKRLVRDLLLIAILALRFIYPLHFDVRRMLRPAPFRAAAARHSVLASPSSCPDSSRFSRPCPEPLACGLSYSFVHSRCSHSRLNRTARPEACCSTLNALA